MYYIGLSFDSPWKILYIDMINNQIASGVSVQMYREYENPHFSCIFKKMDISLITALICLKTCMCIAEICMEG